MITAVMPASKQAADFPPLTGRAELDVFCDRRFRLATWEDVDPEDGADLVERAWLDRHCGAAGLDRILRPLQVLYETVRRCNPELAHDELLAMYTAQRLVQAWIETVCETLDHLSEGELERFGEKLLIQDF